MQKWNADIRSDKSHFVLHDDGRGSTDVDLPVNKNDTVDGQVGSQAPSILNLQTAWRK